MDFIVGFFLLDIGVAIGIGVMCLIALRRDCNEHCLHCTSAGYTADTE